MSLPGISETSSTVVNRFDTVGSGISLENQASSSPENITSSAATISDIFTYPLNENMKFRTVIRFYDYQRNFGDAAAQRELQETVVLPIPFTISDEYGMNLTDTDLGIFEAVTEYVSRGGSISGDKIFESAWDAALGTMQNPRDAAAIIGSISPIAADRSQDFVRSRTGIVRNPHTTLLFNGVQLKSFNLSWRLSPRSKDEADVLIKIIDLIKKKMHPSENEVLSTYALDYPDLCKIEFEGTKGITPIDFSFIENMGMNFGAAGGVSFFEDGVPSEVEFFIRLREIDINTREDL